MWEVRRLAKIDLLVVRSSPFSSPEQTVLDVVVIFGQTRQSPRVSDQNFTSTRSHKPVLEDRHPWLCTSPTPPQRHAGADRSLSGKQRRLLSHKHSYIILAHTSVHNRSLLETQPKSWRPVPLWSNLTPQLRLKRPTFVHAVRP